MPLTRAEAVDASFPQASDFRKHRAGIFPREGIYPDPTTTAAAGIAYAGSGWAVGARAFVAEVKRGGAPYSQAYGSAPVSNDSNVATAWTIGAAPASGARIDLLCIRIRDVSQSDSSSGAPTDGPSGAARTGFPEFLVVPGTAGTTPARPALPAGYEEIAQIQTPAGAASTAGSTITQTYAFAHTVGGTIVVRTIAERDALASPIPGDDVYVIATGQTFTYVANAVTPGWFHSAGKPDIAAVTITGVNLKARAGTFAPRARKQNGMIFLEGSGDATGATTWNAGTTYTFGNIPVGYRPSVPVEGLIRFRDGVAVVSIQVNGDILFATLVTVNGTLDSVPIPLTGLSYPDPALV